MSVVMIIHTCCAVLKASVVMIHLYQRCLPKDEWCDDNPYLWCCAKMSIDMIHPHLWCCAKGEW